MEISNEDRVGIEQTKKSLKKSRPIGDLELDNTDRIS